MIKIIRNYLSLYRGDVFSVTLAATIAGYQFSTGTITLHQIFTALFISSILYNFVYSLNAVTDYKEDKINKPKRPLPSGDITLSHAIIYVIVLFIISFAGILFLFSGTNLFLAFAILFFGLVYSLPPLALKNIPILASIITGWGMVHPMFISSTKSEFVITMGFIFLGCGITILKDLSDIEGDRLAGRRVIVDIISSKGVLIFSSLFMLLSIATLLYLGKFLLMSIPITCLCMLFYHLFFLTRGFEDIVYKRTIKSAVLAIIIVLFLLFVLS